MNDFFDSCDTSDSSASLSSFAALEPGVHACINDLGFGNIIAVEHLIGGIISRTLRVITSSGQTLVVKSSTKAPPDLYRIEADSLDALRLPTGLHVPLVYAASRHFLVLEDLGPQPAWDELPMPANDTFWDVYGRGLAHLHGRLSSRFGYDHDTYWGLMKLDNRWNADGYSFYADTRYRWFLTRPTCQRGLSTHQCRQIERLADRLPLLIPPQPACLNHGDLWAGNRGCTRAGRPALIDPFIHFGWAEMDLHNCQMYGGFPARFFSAYNESHPLESGWRERAPVLFVPHLLGLVDHGAELTEVLPWLQDILDRFAGSG